MNFTAIDLRGNYGFKGILILRLTAKTFTLCFIQVISQVKVLLREITGS